MHDGIKSGTFVLIEGPEVSIEELNENLSAMPFAPCGPTDMFKAGFASVEKDVEGPLALSVGTDRVVRLVIEKKSVPGSLVNKKATEAANKIKDSTGRTPGKKEMRQIKEDVKLSLLPQAFPKTNSVYMLLGVSKHLGRFMFIDTTSSGLIDEAITAISGLTKWQYRHVQTRLNPQIVMSQWLRDEDAQDYRFALMRSCLLVGTDEMRGQVSLKREHLMTDEVRRHIEQGKVVRELELQWCDRVTLVLTGEMALKKVAFEDVVFTDANYEGGLEANVAIIGAEMTHLLEDLVDVFGGPIAAEQGETAAVEA
jgi:recombination associated protein RdgC